MPIPPSSDARPTVIVVDDDDAVRHAVAFDLTVEGYVVSVFSDGESLLGLAEPPTAACLVVDYRLRRIDGLILITTLRARGLTAPAILVTSHPNAHLRSQCAGLGVPIVEKPLLRDDLARAVAAAVGPARA